MPARTPRQIFQHHAEALGAEDIDGLFFVFCSPLFGSDLGGAWTIPPKELRSAYRVHDTPSTIAPTIGFRVARTLSR